VKTCPYCGQEYPDDATVCSIDRQSLDPKTPTKPSPAEILAKRAETSAHMAARPFTVTFAVQLLAADMVFILIQDIVRHLWYVHRFPNFHHWINFYFPTTLGCGLWTLFIYFIYRGKNWARWFLSCVIVVWAIAAPFMLIGPLHWDFYFQMLLDGFAVVALFQRESNEWYKGAKKIVSESAPAV